MKEIKLLVIYYNYKFKRSGYYVIETNVETVKDLLNKLEKIEFENASYFDTTLMLPDIYIYDPKREDQWYTYPANERIKKIDSCAEIARIIKEAQGIELEIGN